MDQALIFSDQVGELLQKTARAKLLGFPREKRISLNMTPAPAFHEE